MAAAPFRLVRSNIYQLRDLSSFLDQPSTSTRTSRTTTMNIDRMSQSYSGVQYPSWSGERLSRVSSDVSRPSRHHSLVSMRTYYAFGARSASLSGGGRGAVGGSGSTSRTAAMYSPPTRSTVCPPLNYLPRSSTSTLYSYDRGYSSQPTSSSIIRPSYSTSTSSSYLPISSYRTSGIRTSSHTAGAASSSIHFSDLKTDQSAPPRPSRHSTNRSSPPPPSSSASSTRRGVQPLKLRVEVDRDEDRRGGGQLPSEQNRAEIDSIRNELEELKKRNKLLEDDLLRLKLVVKDKERSEVELKSRLLESEAETKVWKNKCGLIESATHEPQESASIDPSILDQLDSAADKLARLNAVKDLKLLQSEMETALQEIRDK